jgi:hypothetical protein
MDSTWLNGRINVSIGTIKTPPPKPKRVEIKLTAIPVRSTMR